jgi:hypothetical protein
MDYTPLIDASGWYGWALLPVTILIAAFIAFVLLTTIFSNKTNTERPEFAKKHPKILVSLVLGGVALYSVITVLISITVLNNLDATTEQNLQTAKDNISAKYDMDVSTLEFAASGWIQTGGEGTQSFTVTDEASYSYLSVDFEESGEPFIKVNDIFTKETVESMLR